MKLDELVELSASRAAYQRDLSARLRRVLTSIWGELDGRALDESWAALGGRVVTSVVVAQRLAALGAHEYVDSAVSAQGVDPERSATIAPETFAGYAADGEPHDGRAHSSIVATKWAISEGATLDAALSIGLSRLLRYSLTEVGASARLADGSALALEPTTTGYLRRVNLPSCGRCIVLASRYYARSAGFQRHPRCDCMHVPVTSRTSPPSPSELLSRMSSDELRAALGKANAEAVEAGADLGSVVNASNGTAVPGVTRAGRAGRRTPAELLKQYGEDPLRYLEALRANGYVVG